MIILQKPLFSFNEFMELNHDERLVAVLDVLKAEPLIAHLNQERKGRRNDYPIRVMWNTLIAGIVYEIPTITGLIEELKRNPYLCYVCGIKSRGEIPSQYAYSRFLKKLIEHEEYIDAMFKELVEELKDSLPDFGQRQAIDATDIDAYCNPNKKENSDKDARWGVKKKPKGKRDEKYYWLGYKLHLIVDTKYELPIGMKVTSANKTDSTEYIPLLKEEKENHPEIAERCKEVLADAGYDSKKNYKYTIEEFKAVPLIPLNLRGEKETPGICNSQGTPVCMAGFEMKYWGYDNGYLKYRAPCIVGDKECPFSLRTRCCHPDSYGTVVKINIKDDYRRFIPIPRESKKFKKIYKERVAVERVNSRLKEYLLINDLKVRGKKKVKARIGLGILIMLAGAVAMVRKGEIERIRQILNFAA